MTLILLITDEESPEPIAKNENINIIIIGNKNSEVEILRALAPNNFKEKQLKPHPKFSGFNALVVDDNKINQEIASALLARLDMTVIIADNGHDALDKIETNDIDIIFMDVQMPVMDGLEATSILRERGYKTPIIAITAAADPNDKKAAFRAGMDDFLVKPIIFDALYESIEKHLQSSESLSTINLPLAKENLENNDELLAKLFTQFVNDYNDFSTKADILIKNRELESLIRLVHTLKGLAGTLGLELLQQSTQSIEKNLIDEKSINLSSFNEQLTLTLFAVKQFLIAEGFKKEHKQLNQLENEDSVIDNIYSLALTARPVPSSLIRQLEMDQYDRGHSLFKLKEAIDHFNYALVIELIDKYRNDNKN
ncbi:response regulator [Pseudoalteromonas sp. B129b]